MSKKNDICTRVIADAKKLDPAGYEESLSHIEGQTHTQQGQQPDDLEGFEAAEVMAAIDVLAQRPLNEGWTDEAEALDPFGMTVIVRIGSIVALNSSLNGMGFTRYDTEDEAIRVFNDEVERAGSLNSLADLGGELGLEGF